MGGVSVAINYLNGVQLNSCLGNARHDSLMDEGFVERGGGATAKMRLTNNYRTRTCRAKRKTKEDVRRSGDARNKVTAVFAGKCGHLCMT